MKTSSACRNDVGVRHRRDPPVVSPDSLATTLGRPSAARPTLASRQGRVAIAFGEVVEDEGDVGIISTKAVS
jgi:hypothetical protein